MRRTGAERSSARSPSARPYGSARAASRPRSGPAGRRPRCRTALEAARRVDVEEHVQERDVLGLGGPDGLDTELEQHAADLVRMLRRIQVAAVCASSGGVRRLPGRVERHTAREPVEAQLRLLDVDEHRRIDPRDRAAVAAQRAPRTRSGSRPLEWVGKVSTPSSRASAAMRSWVGPIHCPPTSTTLPSPMSWFSERPPTRSRASTTTTDGPPPRSRGGGQAGEARPHHDDVGFLHVASLLCSHASRNSLSRARGGAPPQHADADDRKRRVGFGGRRHLAAVDRRHMDSPRRSPLSSWR